MSGPFRLTLRREGRVVTTKVYANERSANVARQTVTLLPGDVIEMKPEPWRACLACGHPDHSGRTRGMCGEIVSTGWTQYGCQCSGDELEREGRALAQGGLF